MASYRKGQWNIRRGSYGDGIDKAEREKERSHIGMAENGFHLRGRSRARQSSKVVLFPGFPRRDKDREKGKETKNRLRTSRKILGRHLAFYLSCNNSELWLPAHL